MLLYSWNMIPASEKRMANAQALMVHETFNLAQMLLGLHPMMAVSDEMFLLQRSICVEHH